MNIKSLLLGSAAALVAVTGARAADAVVVAEPEPVEYVRVCDAYGAGFFYIPGTETCLKISGHVRYDAHFGDDAYNGVERGTWRKRSRASLRFDARTETELGTLKSFAEARFQFTNAVDEQSLPNAYIELGGFRVGVTDSQFASWTDYVGDIISDDVVSYGPFETNQINYTFTGDDGFSAMIGLEQGAGEYVVLGVDEDGEIVDVATYSNVIDDYVPHIVAGLKYQQGWGGVSAVGGYDSNSEEFAGKVRLDVKFSDTISAFVMGGYKTSDDETPNFYGSWNGEWAVWGGVAATVNDKATVNAQVAYEEDGTIAAAANVKYELVPGFVITPEVNYTSFGGYRQDLFAAGDDAFQGIIRFQRNF